MISFLLELTLLFALSFVVACFNYALEVWMSPNHILHSYYLFLEKNRTKWWTKPLGLCVMCCNVWCELIAFIILVIYLNQIESIWLIFFAPVVGNMWLRKVLN